MKYIITPEGRLKNTGTNAAPVWAWEYNLTDHLGNVRVVFRPGTSNTAEVIEYNNYFPFGMKMTPYLCQTTTDNKYLYNGKEQQTDFGLNWYDYGARFYDPSLGRWHSVDPLAEVSRRWSPYTYCYNNPMGFIDPDGMAVYKYKIDINSSGEWVEEPDDIWRGGGSPLEEYQGLNKNGYGEESGLKFQPNFIAGDPQGQGGSGWLDNLQTGLDVAGIADPTGLVDLGNALIYAGRGQWGNAGISALAIIPYIGDVGKAGRLGTKAYAVYQGVDRATGAVKYVGITSREVTQRAAEHMAKGDAWKALDFRAIPGTFDRTGARIMEQNLINQHGLPNLFNKINSISPKKWSMYGIE